MSKKKEIEQNEVEEIVVEEVKESDEEIFIRNKLKAINKMSNAAKAERLAKRILKNRKGK